MPNCSCMTFHFAEENSRMFKLTLRKISLPKETNTSAYIKERDFNSLGTDKSFFICGDRYARRSQSH